MRILMSNSECSPPVRDLIEKDLKCQFYSLFSLSFLKSRAVFIIIYSAAVLNQSDVLDQKLFAAWLKECCSTSFVYFRVLNRSLGQKLVKSPTVWLTAIVCQLLHVDVPTVLISMLPVSYLRSFLFLRCRSRPRTLFPHTAAAHTALPNSHLTHQHDMKGTRNPPARAKPTTEQLACWLRRRWFIASWLVKPKRAFLWCLFESLRWSVMLSNAVEYQIIIKWNKWELSSNHNSGCLLALSNLDPL